MKTKPLTILIPAPDEAGFCSKECPMRNDGIGGAYGCPYSHHFFKQPDKGCPWYKYEGGEE